MAEIRTYLRGLEVFADWLTTAVDQRRHTRLRYERHGDVWTRGQLWP
jgi:hypothetical protein